MRVHRETMFESVLLDGRPRERGFYRPDVLPSQRLFVDPGSRGRELARPPEYADA